MPGLGMKLGLGLTRRGGGASVPVLALVTDSLDADPPTYIFTTTQAGTVTWDFDSSGSDPGAGNGNIATGSEAVTSGENTITLDLSAVTGTGRIYFRQGASNVLVSQEITAAGPNLVVDGSWTTDGTWTESPAGTLTAVNGSNFGATQTILTVGRTYEVSMTISSYTSGQLDIRVGNSGPCFFNATATGTYTTTRTQSGNINLNMMGSGTFNGVVTNITCRDVTTP